MSGPKPACAFSFSYMLVTFDRKIVETLLAHSKSVKAWQALYENPTTAAPGLWLVGSNGVCLMDNANRHLLSDGSVATGQEPMGAVRCLVCYADQVNPDRMAFDEWWYNKRQSFGGDDGSEFISAERIENWLHHTAGNRLSMELTPTHIELLGSITPDPVQLAKDIVFAHAPVTVAKPKKTKKQKVRA